MSRYWVVLVVAGVSMAALVGWPALASADEVTIKVIEPDKPPPPPPTTPQRTAPAERPDGDDTDRPAVAPTGNRRLDGALRRLDLTVEQTERLAPILDAARAEREQTEQRFGARVDSLREQIRQAGGDQEKARQLGEQLGQAFTDRRQAETRAQQQLTEKLRPVLTEQQAARLTEALDDSPAAQSRRRAAGAVRFLAGDIELSEQQQEQARTVIEQRTGEFTARMQELREQMQPLWQTLRDDRDNADARRSLEELGTKMRTLMQEQMSATRQALDEVLTPEQRAQVEQARQGRAEQMAQRMVDMRVRAFEAAELSEAQKQQVDELARAAREAMAKLPAEDWQARGELSEQLRADIEKLLTEEQKAKVAAQGRGGFGRGGMFGGRGDGPGPGGETGQGRGFRGRGGQGGDDQGPRTID